MMVITKQQLRNLVLATIAAGILMACQPQADEQAGHAQPPAPQISVAKVINERITEWDEFTNETAGESCCDCFSVFRSE